MMQGEPTFTYIPEVFQALEYLLKQSL